MMSIGQATAQSLQAMQRSKEKRNMPRKRSAGSIRSSGYRMVTLGTKSSRRVVFSPSKMSSRRNFSDQRFFGYSTCMDHLPGRGGFRFRLEEVEGRRGDHDHAEQSH